MVEVRPPNFTDFAMTRLRSTALASQALLVTLLLSAGCRSLPPNSLATHVSTRWEREIAAFQANDATNPPPRQGIEFVGSSSIRKWSSLADDFPGLPVFNRGFGGSQLADSARFADRIIIPYRPRQVVIYAGGNDINAGKDPEIVFGDFVALVTEIQSALPDVKISFISSAPNPSRWAQVERVKKLNHLVQTYCRRHKLDFVDVFPLMLGPDGLPKPNIYLADRLHMNAEGYTIWKNAVRPHLH
jgi:lysophospholipase L1-like esterase